MKFLRTVNKMKPVVKAMRLPLSTFILSIAQALFGPLRWNLFQLLLGVSHAPIPRIPAIRILHVLHPFAAPTLCTWIYGVTARLLFPVHRRSLSFWSRVLPIYAGYKRTQISLALQRADSRKRERVWDARHQWGASKVYNLCVELRGFYLKDGKFSFYSTSITSSITLSV